MANRAFQFHTATKGCFSTANNYGVRRCSSYVPYAVGWHEYQYQHHFMINSQPSCSATAATPIRSHLHYYHQSQSFREINLNTDLVHRRSFSGTTSDKNGNDIAAGRSDNIDRSKFTHEVKIEMPNLDDDIKGEYMCAFDDVLLCHRVIATFDNTNEFRFSNRYCNRQLLCKGVIEKWYKKEGDIIKKDEVICDIRTEVRILRTTQNKCIRWSTSHLPLLYSYSPLEC